ncbi:MAG: hypothetical protein K9J13_04960 [Saprospiraceae bacterium]|nr:hypothetical protein [Saprospiraceae bacterium]
MNKIIGLTLGFVLLISCSTINNPTVLNTKEYYFPYKDFTTPQTYCYVNTIDSTDKSFWIMRTIIEGKDTFFLTNIQDYQHRLTEELVEKIVDKGSRMFKYTLYKYDSNNAQISSPCQVIDSVIFNWNQNIGESITWKVYFPEFASKKTIEFTKNRTLISIDSLNSVVTFKDNNSMIMKGSFRSNDYEIENYYKKGTGLINYKILEQGRLFKDYKLINK